MDTDIRSHFTFKQRNFDPETRQIRSREKGDVGEDTVEAAVEGLAESILKEDEEKRKEELVSCISSHPLVSPFLHGDMYNTVHWICHRIAC